MKMQEQPTNSESQFIENFFIDEKFFSDTDEYLIEVLENQYEVESVSELPDSFNETIEFSDFEHIIKFTAEDIAECCISDDRLPEDDDTYLDHIVELLKKHIDFDKLNAEIPKLYYQNGKKMDITKVDLIDWYN